MEWTETPSTTSPRSATTTIATGSRHELAGPAELPWKYSDETLDGLTVGIVGLGGGGSHVTQQIGHVGVGGFVLLDDDCIDETNLNRLVGGTREVVTRGARKFEIAERVIRAENPEARWQESLDLLLGCDVVFGCLDNVRGKDDLEAHCRRVMIP